MEISSTLLPSFSSSACFDAVNSCASSDSLQNVRNLCDQPCDCTECPVACSSRSCSQPRNFASVPIRRGVTKYVAEILCPASRDSALCSCDCSPSSNVICG